VDRHTCIDLRLGGRVSRQTGAPVRRRRGAGTADTGARRIRLPTRPAKDTRVSTPTSRYRAFTRPGWLPPRRRCRRHKELIGTGHPQHPSRYRAAHTPAPVPPLALRQSGRLPSDNQAGSECGGAGRRPCERSGGPSSPAPVADTGGTAGAHTVRGSGPNRAPSGEVIGVRSIRASLLRIWFHLRGPLHPRHSWGRSAKQPLRAACGSRGRSRIRRSPGRPRHR
jgi:hypothetical protein